MGFLEKLLRRRKSEAGQGMKTAPSPASMPAEPASMPAEDTQEHSPGENDHAQEHNEDQGSSGGGAS